MKLKVTFREYMLSDDEERGEYLGSFGEEIKGRTPIEILTIADGKAKEYSKKNSSDVRVWETVVVITPRGIVSS